MPPAIVARARLLDVDASETASNATAKRHGGCACGAIRYRLESSPLFVHCCHCTWCQRESGSAFAVNALIETDRVFLLGGAPKLVVTPSASGKGQRIYRCPHCEIAVWSHFAMAVGEKVSFIRAGTLDASDRLAPDIHIFTATKMPWLKLGSHIPVVAEYYDRKTHWPEESLARFQVL